MRGSGHPQQLCIIPGQTDSAVQLDTLVGDKPTGTADNEFGGGEYTTALVTVQLISNAGREHGHRGGLTRGGVHHSFECIGLKQTAEQAFAMLARGGTATIIGMIEPGLKIELDPYQLLHERRVQGSLMGSNRFPVDMPRLVDFYMAGKLKLDEMISQRINPFFVWMNTTRMHLFTHVRESMKGQSGMPGNDYADGMLEHDGDVGKLLRTLDDLKIADNTIVVYTTDNGPNQFSWPDAATTPFRSEKNSNWEGAYRVPALVRWPGKIKAGEVSNEMFSGMDWFPTLLAAAGDTAVKDKLLKGWAPVAGGTSFKVHLDGYNQLPYLTGQQPKGERHEFYYFNDDGMLVSMRFDNWKAVFAEQRAPGGFAVWSNPFTPLRIPKIFNLRMAPYECADQVSDQYYDWTTKNAYLIGVSVSKAAKFLQTFIEYPPAQKPASFSIDQIRAAVDEKIEEKMKAQSKQ
jgi:hypothetical protein